MRLPPDARQAAALRRRLLAHYDAHRRDLPWRRARDPYRVLVSEFMLQQTTVGAVLPYYERFLARFPTLASLAVAADEEVLAAWAGLGYYSRARRLRDTCRALRERHGGRLPRTLAELRALPGVGAYTAGALASIVHGLPEPVLDGNVRRVLSRLAAAGGAGAAFERRLEAAARALVRGPRPGALNQALMELGARLCTPRSPRCGECPVSRSCAARRGGDPERFPAKRPRPAPVDARGCVFVVREPSGGIWLVQRPAAGRMEGMWELPGDAGLDTAPRATRRSAQRCAERQIGRALARGRRLGMVRHVVLDRRLRIDVYEASPHGSGRSQPAGRRAQSRRVTRAAGPTRATRLFDGGPPPALTAASRKALALAGAPERA